MLKYILYQNTNQSMTSAYQKWYAKAQIEGVKDTDDLAEVIQRNCTAKKSDVLAVLSELVEVMTTELQNGNRVKLNGFGSFKLGLRSKGAEKPEDFSVTKNIKGVRVLFTPETHTDQAGSTVKTLITGVRLKLSGTASNGEEVKP